MWSGQNHPCCHHRAADSVLSFLNESISLNLSGKSGHGEGLDFRLEDTNKQVQKWSSNVPSTKDWQIVCSNVEQLHILRETVFQQMGISDSKEKKTKYVQNIHSEVAAIRKQKYLLHPNDECKQVSFDGELLDEDLHAFCSLKRYMVPFPCMQSKLQSNHHVPHPSKNPCL